MKKNPILMLGIALLIAISGGGFANATPAPQPDTPTLDRTANFTPLRANKFYTAGPDGVLCQMFEPSKEVIANYLDIRGAGDYTNSTDGVEMLIFDTDGSYNPANVINNYVASQATFNDGRNTFTRFTAENYARVIPGNLYWLCMITNLGVEASWYADSPDGGFGSSTYDGGYLRHGRISEPTEDFGFNIYSSNFVIVEQNTPSPSPSSTNRPTASASPSPSSTTTTTTTDTSTNPTVSSAPVLPAGTTAGSGAAPTTTTTTIKAPSGLTVVDLPADNGGSLKLDWKASTTADIDGYKIFRSTAEKTGFAEIAKTEKTVITFTDTQATLGQKYYYMVRAYKDTKESASTKTLNSISVDNMGPIIPQQFQYQKQTTGALKFVWAKNVEADLASYIFQIASTSNEAQILETIDFGKDISTYDLDFAVHPSLSATESYKYYLTAKDSNNNLSDRATAVEVTAAPLTVVETTSTTSSTSPVDIASTSDLEEDTTIPWYYYLVGDVLLLGISGSALYWFKFRKPSGVKLGKKPAFKQPMENATADQTDNVNIPNQ